jgi:hypothetical protein
VLGLIALILLLLGKVISATFFATLILIVGMTLIAVTVERHHRCVDLQRKLAYSDEVTDDLFDAIEKWHGLKRNFTMLVDEHKAKFDSLWHIERTNWEAKKVELDRQREEIAEHADAVQTVAERLIKDTIRWASKNIKPNNFVSSRQQIERVIDFCRRKGAHVPVEIERKALGDLRDEFEEAVRKESARAEQQRIKEKIREEQRAQREFEQELNRLETQRTAIVRAIEEAVARTRDEHSAEVEELRRKLREAEARSRRAQAMAEMTKAGHVYIISNIGSFGEGVFKIGMTRRLEPLDRIKELGDASVPFGFDIHMMISADDAPKLENVLHRELHHQRVNKINHRKEFFRSSIEEIRDIVIRNHGTVDYVAVPEAVEYRESLCLDGDDLEFVERVLDEYQDDDDE